MVWADAPGLRSASYFPINSPLAEPHGQCVTQEWTYLI